ncbi:PWWP domain-containing protein MUM1-like [Hippocampus comes]|uniref:PWWP domain-containing protein MUM1-like n=1 Tax=Hippocampus comes TaxID=109280 RepID=UPI00094EB529|nr:PREDICTED: PWWP domain-containing protein MUM1-like [Hippocampus comes]
MPLIRKWWCLFLMERFEIEGHGQRFAFWTDEARALLQGLKAPVYRVPRGSGITLKCPDHVLVAADRSAKEKQLVDLIVQSGEAEQHIVDVLKGKPRYFKHECQRVPVYLDTEEHRDVLYRHLRGIADREGTPNNIVDEVDFLMDVLFPEAIIYGLAVTHKVSVAHAENLFIVGQTLHTSERDQFEQRIEKELRQQGK